MEFPEPHSSLIFIGYINYLMASSYPLNLTSEHTTIGMVCYNAGQRQIITQHSISSWIFSSSHYVHKTFCSLHNNE